MAAEPRLERYASAFRDNEITAEVLPELTDADLRELGLPLGPRKVLLKAIAALRTPSACVERCAGGFRIAANRNSTGAAGRASSAHGDVLRSDRLDGALGAP